MLVAAKECGVTALFKAGGAQAIAALAYGTESIPKADVIAGPGNIFVTLAKKEVYGDVGIDMLAGPSEILIIADGRQKEKFVAADVLSQAEHDRLSRAIVLTDDAAFAERLCEEVERQIEFLPRKDIARASLENGGGVILVEDMRAACELANEIAPEHLEIAARKRERTFGIDRLRGRGVSGKLHARTRGRLFRGTRPYPSHGAERRNFFRCSTRICSCAR